MSGGGESAHGRDILPARRRHGIRRHGGVIATSHGRHCPPGPWEAIAGTTDGSGIASNLTGAAPKGAALSLWLLE